MEKLEQQAKQTLYSTVEEAVQLEELYLQTKEITKDITKKRRKFKKDIGDSLARGERLPNDSDYWAGMNQSDGRIRWSGVAQTLYQTLNEAGEMTYDELQEVVNENRGSSIRRVNYGRIENLKPSTLNQLELFTPQI